MNRTRGLYLLAAVALALALWVSLAALGLWLADLFFSWSAP